MINYLFNYCLFFTKENSDKNIDNENYIENRELTNWINTN